MALAIERILANVGSWRAKADAEERRPISDEQYAFWFGETRAARVGFLRHCADSAESAADTLKASLA
jgi:hypothetical protein